MYKKNKVMIVLVTFSAILLLGVSACSHAPEIDTEMTKETDIETDLKADIETDIIADITQISFDLYEKAVQENKAADLEVVRHIVNRFGENGYVAIDSKNQIDMTKNEQVIQFCEKVETKKEAELTIIEVTYLGGFSLYELQTKDGKVNVVKSYYSYMNGVMKNVLINSYEASFWEYTEDGYLLFSGECFSEETYVLTLSETEEHTAFRIQPLDEKCRELNRQYILPISYAQNNMFLVDWSEDDFGELNFYDLYEIFYPIINLRFLPYAADENLGVGAVYQIPKMEFESIIMTYIKINSEILQSKTIYNSKNLTYEYKPRGFYEAGFSDYPYPEVISFTENDDETITLTVNVIFPHTDISKVYTHQVVVRPLADGGVQYVSNRIIQSKHNFEPVWYTPRLTEEEWEEVYPNDKKILI